MGFTVGRVPSDLLDKPHVHDAPERTVEALVTKVDQLINTLNTMVTVLGPKLDADTGVAGTDFTAVLTTAFGGAVVKKLDLIL